ncbi:MAG: hypothetical protein M3Z92_07815 [Bacteroidota bacterium]|nr:hypothetical protein [Bacteroidota bacterium]
MQEGFVQVFKSLHNFKYAGSFEGWIRKIMVYCAIQKYRSKSKMHPVVDIETIQTEQICKEDILARIQKKNCCKWFRLYRLLTGWFLIFTFLKE